jgi:hypothetical protein
MTRAATAPPARRLSSVECFLEPRTMSSCGGLGSHCIAAKSTRHAGPGRNITQSNVSFQPSSSPSPSPVHARSDERWEKHVAASLLFIVQSMTGVGLRAGSQAWGALTESQFRQEPKQQTPRARPFDRRRSSRPNPRMKTRCCLPGNLPDEPRFCLSVWVLHESSPLNATYL